MERFEGRIAVITGGGTGMGRELVRQLAAEGCHVGMCDVSEEAMEQSRDLALRAAPSGTRISTCVADVSAAEQVEAFRDAVAADHSTDHVHLLFNNAGIGGGGSFVEDDRDEWETTFAVCWNGVYLCCRAFLPMLLRAPEGHVINTSSVNGFWASVGPTTAHTAYSAAKFAVKGFSEALINDFRLNAPHLKVSVVMPGHIGTSIVSNSGRILGRDPKELPDEELLKVRDRMMRRGLDLQDVTADQMRQGMAEMAEQFRTDAPMSAEEAAKVILDGVREARWRILVGEDAHVLDRMVRETPEEAYEPEFMQRFVAQSGWKLGF